MTATDAIVLVGGLGTRLRDTVPGVPKPLAPVAGRPFLHYLLDAYALAGIERIILATGYEAGQVQAAVGQRWAGMEVVYSHESSPLGTGGAIRQAAGMVRGRGTHLANGDTYLRYRPGELEALVLRAGARLGMALARVDDVERYGAVELDAERVTGFAEKGGNGAGWINAGNYFLSEEGIALLPDVGQFSFEECVLRPWAGAGCVVGDTRTSDFIDIGIPEDYFRAQRMFAPEHP